LQTKVGDSLAKASRWFPAFFKGYRPFFALTRTAQTFNLSALDANQHSIKLEFAACYFPSDEHQKPEQQEPPNRSMKIPHTLKTSFCLLVGAALVAPLYAADKELKSAAVTAGDLGNPFFVQIARGAEAKAKEINPKVKFSSQSSNYDVNNQSNQVDNLVSSGVNIILLGAADSKGIAPAVKRAKGAGVVVIAVDVGAEGGVDATVMSNNRQAGQQAAQYIVDKLKGKGQIVIVNGPPVTAVQDRVAGAMDVFSKNPDIKILSQDQNAGGSRDGGLRVMTDLLTANKKLDAVFAINDPTAIGADLAAKQANRSEFFIVGVDGSPDAVSTLKSKGSLFEATPAQDPYAMAQKAVEIGYDVMNGKKPESDTILIPTQLITRDNVNEYKGWTK
jgi:ribose transport system substrate-binding protein